MALQTWQRRVGLPADGRLLAGDLVFLTGLPRRLAAPDRVAVGAAIAPGADLLIGVTGGPTVVVKAGLDQVGVLPTSGDVTVTGAGRNWRGTVGRVKQLPSGEVELPLQSKDGGPICGTECDASIPIGDVTIFEVQISTVPTTTGPVVPVSALTTDAANSAVVTMADGKTVPVTVLASAKGLAVVKGLAVGQRILMPTMPTMP